MPEIALDFSDLSKAKSSPEYKRLKALLKDPEWRIDNLYWIKDEDGNEIRFVRNPAQRAYFAARHFRDLIPKSRQLGFSTLLELLMLDTCLFSKGTRAGIIDDTLDAAKKKLDIVKFAYDRLPDQIGQAVPLNKRNTESLEFANGSSIEIGTSARGGTFQFLHSCLTGDTGIYTKGAVVKPISEIKVGDLVLTSAATYLPVRGVIKNKLSDLGVGLLELSIFGYYGSLKITENHRVLTRQKGKTKEPVWKRAGDVKRGDYLAIPIREPSSNLRDGKIPFGDTRVIPDERLGWLCGFYLAEGSIRERNGNPPTEVLFSVDKDEVQMVLDALSKVFLGDTPLRRGRRGAKRTRVYEYVSRTRVVTVNSRALAVFLHHHFGYGDEKKIPDKIWKWGAPFMHALMKGYIDGDGSYSDDRLITVVSTRRQLIDQLRLMCIALRYGMPTIYHSPAGQKYGRNCKAIWTLNLHGPANWKYRERYGLRLPTVNTWTGKWRIAHNTRPDGRKMWRRGTDVYWGRVQGIKEIAPVEFVYDLALDEVPHDYVTVNGVVHNSELGKTSIDSPNRAKEIKLGAIPAVHAGNVLVIESTAHGTAGEFHDMVQRAAAQQKEGRPLSALDFKLHFFGWWIKPEYRVPNHLVQITEELRQYFAELAPALLAQGVRLDANQQAWYAQQYYELGPDDCRTEYPSTFLECFYNSLAGAYFKAEMSKARSEQRIGFAVPHDPTRRVNTFWDIGEDGTAVIFHQTDGLRHRMIDYWEAEGSSLQEAAGVLEEKRANRKFLYDKHYGPHDLDNKDWAHHSQSRKQVALGLGINFTVVPRVLVKADSIEAARRMIGLSWFDVTHCSLLVDRLDNYRKKWNKALGQFSAEPEHKKPSHPSDALQQGAMGLAPDRVPREKRGQERRHSAWGA